MIPLYKIFCQKVGLEGDFKQKEFGKLNEKIGRINKNRKIEVIFESIVDPNLKWEFEPLQDKVIVHPGETALAFYKVINH